MKINSLALKLKIVFLLLDFINAHEECRYRVFCDLHEKGFFLTSACKFGADFLVYEGDPMVHHASYTAVCLDSDHIQLHSVLSQVRN